jgi:hypothetical protein
VSDVADDGRLAEESSVDALEGVAARFVDGGLPVQVTAKTVKRIDTTTPPIIARDFHIPSSNEHQARL